MREGTSGGAAASGPRGTAGPGGRGCGPGAWPGQAASLLGVPRREGAAVNGDTQPTLCPGVARCPPAGGGLPEAFQRVLGHAAEVEVAAEGSLGAFEPRPWARGVFQAVRTWVRRLRFVSCHTGPAIPKSGSCWGAGCRAQHLWCPEALSNPESTFSPSREPVRVLTGPRASPGTNEMELGITALEVSGGCGENPPAGLGAAISNSASRNPSRGGGRHLGGPSTPGLGPGRGPPPVHGRDCALPLSRSRGPTRGHAGSPRGGEHPGRGAPRAGSTQGREHSGRGASRRGAPRRGAPRRGAPGAADTCAGFSLPKPPSSPPCFPGSPPKPTMESSPTPRGAPSGMGIAAVGMFVSALNSRDKSYPQCDGVRRRGPREGPPRWG